MRGKANFPQIDEARAWSAYSWLQFPYYHIDYYAGFLVGTLMHHVIFPDSELKQYLTYSSHAVLKEVNRLKPVRYRYRYPSAKPAARRPLFPRPCLQGL